MGETKQPESRILMRIDGITKMFPGVIAVDNISLDFTQGSIHGIIGKNGAGKTTLVSILSGVIAPTEGELIVGERSFRGLSRLQARYLGIDIVTQEPQIVPMATIYESLFMPDYPLKRNGLIDWKDMKERTKNILLPLGIDINQEIRMKDLSISLQQIFAIIRCFYITKAPVIILDESSASLSESDREIMFSIIRKKKNQHSIVYISHRTDEIVNICDIVTVLRDGKVVCTKSISDLDEKKISAYIIGDAQRAETNIESNHIDKENIVLETEHLGHFGKYDDISLTGGMGEVVGLAGLRGSGRTEIMKAIAGIDPPLSGSMKLNGRPVRFSRPDQAFDHGVAYLPEEREKEGIIDILSVEKNINLIILRKLKNRLGFLSKRRESDSAKKLIEIFEIKCQDAEQELRYLSGGNKQKAVFGKIYATNPSLYLLDEPTKGIDISTKGVLLAMVRNELTKKAGIVLSAPGLEDLVKVCDRIYVLFEGRILKIVDRPDFDEKELYLAIQGVFKREAEKNDD